MAFKFKVKTNDEIPAELVNLYVEREGAWPSFNFCSQTWP